jgi:parallel beta-helix repeat protein
VILLDRSERNNVANNKIVASSAASGIGIYGGAGTNVTSNTITVNHSDSSCTWGCGLGSKTTGVVISDSSGVSMMGNQVSLSGTDSDGSLHGVWVVGSSSNGVIDSNTISGAAQVGVFIDGTGSSAILSNNKVNGNTISGASTGVKISSAVGATVSDNIIANSANTIVVLSSTSTVINGNTLTDNVLPEPVIDTASAATITIDVPFRPFDSDGDGVNDDVDACSGSIIDAGPVAGTYAWLGGLYLKTADQKTKQVVDSTYSMVQTNGCTCAQIVASKAGSDKGQLKNGCTRGTMENYIAQKGSIKPSLLNAMFDGLSDAFVVIGLLVALVVGYLVGKRK